MVAGMKGQPMKTNNTRVLVAGDIMLDIYSFGRASRISPEAPVPVLVKKKEKCNTVWVVRLMLQPI